MNVEQFSVVTLNGSYDKMTKNLKQYILECLVSKYIRPNNNNKQKNVMKLWQLYDKNDTWSNDESSKIFASLLDSDKILANNKSKYL